MSAPTPVAVLLWFCLPVAVVAFLVILALKLREWRERRDTREAVARFLSPPSP